MSQDTAQTECRWESGELGLSAEHAKPAPATLGAEVDDALGLQMISIRLPRSLIDDLKLIAKKEGLGYQPLVRRVLMRFAEMEFRSMAHEKLEPVLSQSESDCGEEPMRAYG